MRLGAPHDVAASTIVRSADLHTTAAFNFPRKKAAILLFLILEGEAPDESCAFKYYTFAQVFSDVVPMLK